MGRRARGAGNGLWFLAGVPLLALLAIPVLALVVNASPAEILAQLRTEECVAAIGVSARTTAVSLVFLLSFGTPVAYALAGRPFAGRRVLDALLALPAALPPAVAGIALLLAFGREGLLGPALSRVGIRLPFTAGAVVLAQLFVAAPFFLRPVTGAFRAIDSSFVEAAELDGAGRQAIFLRIVLPISRSAITAAATVAWARALGEFGATILFAGNRFGVTRTMPLAVYLGYETDLRQSVALSVILLAVAVAVMLAGAWTQIGRTD